MYGSQPHRCSLVRFQLTRASNPVALPIMDSNHVLPVPKTGVLPLHQWELQQWTQRVMWPMGIHGWTLT